MRSAYASIEVSQFSPPPLDTIIVAPLRWFVKRNFELFYFFFCVLISLDYIIIISHFIFIVKMFFSRKNVKFSQAAGAVSLD